MLVGSSGRKIRLALLVMLLLLLAVVAVVERVSPSLKGPARQWYDRAVDAAGQGKALEAASDMTKSIKLDPHNPMAYELLSDYYLAARDPGPALETLRQLELLYPNRPNISTRVSEAYLLVDNVLMLRWAREAALQAPRSPRARLLLALGLARSGNLKHALAEMTVTETLAPSPALEQAIATLKKPGADAAMAAGLIEPLALSAPYQ
ncbi:MAG TPA: hypothetical protein VFJ58_03005 [Armatimonadota bacterium]|nr:hypothetical protein [Armatimonadota bacterium]